MNTRKDTDLNTFAFTPGGSVELATGDSKDGVVIESAEDKVSIMSDFNITRDAAGLALARDLVDVFLGAIQVMKDDQKAGRLPKELSLDKPTVRDNPFA